MQWFPFRAVLLPALLLAAGPPEPLPSPKQLFDRAVAHLQSGRLLEAERDFSAVVRQQPRNVGALGNLGVVYTRQERWEDAVRVYGRALELTPGNAALHLNLGLAYLKQEDYVSARPALERASELRPGDAQARQLLAQARLFTGDAERAIRELESLRGGGGPLVLYLLATGYLRTDRKDAAKAAMEELFASIPAAQANVLAGKAYYDSALFDEALECFVKARELGGDVALDLGKTYVSLRRVPDARASLEEALRARPEDAEALYYLGALLAQEGDDAGVKLLERARELRPKFWGSWYYLGKARAETDAAGAVPLLEKAAELRPGERAVWYLLSRTYRRAGKPEQARAAAARFAEIEKAEATKGSGMK